MAFDYAEQFNAYWNEQQHAEAQSFPDADTLAEEILLSCAGGRVLDIGAGSGSLVQAFLRLGIDAHGVDISSVAVERARTVAPQRFHQGSVLALPFADGSFDTVVASNMLECLQPEDVPQAMAEIRRVTRRAVYLRIASGVAQRDACQHTVQARAWWEQRAFEAGMRKHPAYYQVNDYEALQFEGQYATILLERLPDAAAASYPLSALAEERDLHMDMLREAGSRSDAHVARYHWAAAYIRPGDAVLDAACGLGYGSYLLQSGSPARSTLGIDGSAYAFDYAVENFAAIQPGLQFRCGMLPQALREIPDHSIDVVVSFETLEHIDENVATLAEFHRILTPGGRIITSVPNDWSDASGEDPNPFHVHVYTLERLCRELEQHFVLEELVAQTANQYKMGADRVTWHAAGRSLRQMPLSVRSDGTTPPAEWWLAVAMRSPLEGAAIPYRETTYPVFASDSWNVTAFARDYQNPWLVRGMVDIGHRLRDGAALERLTEQVALQAPPDSADLGAALCVQAYRLLGQRAAPAQQVVEMDLCIEAYLQAGPKTPHGERWSLSLLFALGRLWLEHGDFERARHALLRCVAMDAISFSPLLCNRVVEAHLILGNLEIAKGERAAAVAQWRAGIRLARSAVGGDWNRALGDLEHPAEFGLPELASILEYASACAFALCHADEAQDKWRWWQFPRSDRLSQSRHSAKHARLQLQSVQAELQNYVRQAEEFAQRMRDNAEERTGLLTSIEHQAGELEAYRVQTAEYVRQVAAIEAHALEKEVELGQRDQQVQALSQQLNNLQAQFGQIAALQSELGRYQSQAQQMMQQIASQQTELGSYESQAQQMVRLIAAKEEQLGGYHLQAQLMLEQINVKEKELGDYRLQMQQMAEKITTQQNEINSYRMQTQQMAEQITMQQNEMSSSQLQTRQLTAELAGVRDALALSREQEAQHAAKLSELTQHLAQRELELQHMRMSTSWRVTRPLRFISASLRGKPQ